MIRSATGADVVGLLARVGQQPRDFSAVTLCSPFIDKEATLAVADLAAHCVKNQLGIRILTTRHGKASLRSAFRAGRIRRHLVCGNVRNLHAKVYVAIGRRPTNSVAIVTSANLTQGGLNANVEFGVLAIPTTDAGCKLFGEIVAFVNELQSSGGARLRRRVRRGLIR